jgi:hypothetical protein
LLDGRLVGRVRVAWSLMSAAILISMKAPTLAPIPIATSKAADEGLVRHRLT